MAQSSATLAMHMAADLGHAARAASKTAADSGDTFGERLRQNGADRVSNNRNESIEPEHPSMMSLTGTNVKTGKCG